MSGAKCHRCDRPLATDADHSDDGCGDCARGDAKCRHAMLCWSAFGVLCEAVDWRARALSAEAERDEARADAKRLHEREQHFANALAVADGGRYRNDWDGAMRRMIAERDGAQRLLAAAARGDLQRCDCGRIGMRFASTKPGVSVCDECHAADVRRGWVKAVGDGWPDLPHAAELRAAVRASERAGGGA